MDYNEYNKFVEKLTGNINKRIKTKISPSEISECLKETFLKQNLPQWKIPTWEEPTKPEIQHITLTIPPDGANWLISHFSKSHPDETDNDRVIREQYHNILNDIMTSHLKG